MTEPRARGRPTLAIGMATATALCLACSVALIALAGERAADVGSIRVGEALVLGAPWLAFSIVGAIIVRHRPANPIGWMCSVGGLGVSVIAVSVGIATYALAVDRTGLLGTTAAWIAHTGSITIVAAPLLILYRFPTGRSLGPVWQRIEALTMAYVALQTVLFAVEPMRLLTFPSTANPFAIGSAPRLGALILVPAAVGAGLSVASLVVRFRRGSALERRQIRLLGVASVLVGFAMATMTLTSPNLMTNGQLTTPTSVINAVAFTAVPVAIGIAVVRDRLYDIDRFVHRTLVYALVSAFLAAVYGVAVLALTALLTVLAPDAGSTLATAGSTLLVAALFRPVRARAQGAIDRRFDRERYEASRSIDAFAGQIRAEVELEAIIGDLRHATTRTVRPSSMACWIREPAGD